MYTIRTTQMGKATTEVHVLSKIEVKFWLRDALNQAVMCNHGFVFIPDMGCSGAAIHYTDGRRVEVIKHG